MTGEQNVSAIAIQLGETNFGRLRPDERFSRRMGVEKYLECGGAFKGRIYRRQHVQRRLPVLARCQKRRGDCAFIASR